MATLHLMVGLPGSGKTTEAIKLEHEYKALRLTPDEWQYFLFGHDIADPEHDERHTKVEELMWEIVVKHNDIIWERLAVRNKLAGKNAIFYVGKEEFDEWSGLFEIPAKEELEQ